MIKVIVLTLVLKHATSQTHAQAAKTTRNLLNLTKTTQNQPKGGDYINFGDFAYMFFINVV